MTLAVIAHDAGGAEILSSYVRRESIRPLFALQGPAVAIFTRKLGALENLPLPTAVAQSSRVLCGTSWQSNLEFEAILLARQQDKRCAAFIDHWVNYPERFERAGTTVRPDEIWVGDPIAQRLAQERFAPVPVRLLDNPYFQDIRAELAASIARVAADEITGTVLYVCEPVREHALLRFGNERHFGYTEEEALRFFLAHHSRLQSSLSRIVVRPHPSENPHKYDWVYNEAPLPVRIGGSQPLLEEVARCEVVVGCESMAMVVGLLADKRVVSCIPAGGRPCGLPHTQIEHLQAMVAAQSGRASHR
jgi:hypothetical protein